MALTARGARARDAIAVAATELFLDRGYSATSVRDIATAAAADPAMVLRYFGSKERLFVEVMSGSRERMMGWDGDLATLGERIVRYVLDADAHTRSTYAALVRASEAEGIGVTLRAMHEDGFVRPIAQVIGGEDADVRARLIAAMVGGLMYSLWTVEDDALARADADDIVRRYAPLVQRLVDG